MFEYHPNKFLGAGGSQVNRSNDNLFYLKDILSGLINNVQRWERNFVHIKE